jgi:hypothetical protein
MFCSVQVTGVLKMRTYLSGMPECKLGLNDKVGKYRNQQTFSSTGSSASICYLSRWRTCVCSLLAAEQHVHVEAELQPRSPHWQQASAVREVEAENGAQHTACQRVCVCVLTCVRTEPLL